MNTIKKHNIEFKFKNKFTGLVNSKILSYLCNLVITNRNNFNANFKIKTIFVDILLNGDIVLSVLVKNNKNGICYYYSDSKNKSKVLLYKVDSSMPFYDKIINEK